jgi:hypothetical protein
MVSHPRKLSLGHIFGLFRIRLNFYSWLQQSRNLKIKCKIMKSIILLFFPILSFSQAKLEKIAFLDNKVEILAPKELSIMTDAMWTLKYQKLARPILVLTDKNGEINLIADMTQQPANESQLTQYKDFRISQLKKSRPDLELLADGIKTIAGKKIGYFKFLSQAIDQKVFNYSFFTLVNGKILFFTFNCIQTLQSTWEKTADEIVASLNTK